MENISIEEYEKILDNHYTRKNMNIDYTKPDIEFYFNSNPDHIYRVVEPKIQGGGEIYTKDIELRDKMFSETPFTDEEYVNVSNEIRLRLKQRLMEGTASTEEMANFIKDRQRQLNEKTESENMKTPETNLDSLIENNLSKLNEKALIDSLSTGYLHIVKFTDAATYDEGESDIEILISAEIVNTEESFSFNKWEEIKDKLIEIWT